MTRSLQIVASHPKHVQALVILFISVDSARARCFNSHCVNFFISRPLIGSGYSGLRVMSDLTETSVGTQQLKGKKVFVIN